MLASSTAFCNPSRHLALELEIARATVEFCTTVDLHHCHRFAVVCACMTFVRSQGTCQCPLRAPSPFLCTAATRHSAAAAVEPRHHANSRLWPHLDTRKGLVVLAFARTMRCTLALPLRAATASSRRSAMARHRQPTAAPASVHRGPMDAVCHAGPQLAHHLQPILARLVVVKTGPHRLVLTVLQKGPHLFWELTRDEF